MQPIILQFNRAASFLKAAVTRRVLSNVDTDKGVTES